MKNSKSIRYPRRRLIRLTIRGLTWAILRLICKMQIEGLKNIPEKGRVILAGNHFHFTDPPLIIAACPRNTEFIGGAVRRFGPNWTEIFPRIYGIIYAFRGGNSRSTYKLGASVLKQDGVLGIFIEGGSWAQVLRPARPGTAMIAHMANAPVIPVSIVNAIGLFKSRRPTVRIVFHPPIFPPDIATSGRARRRALDTYSEQIMEVIASELPDNQRGRFASNTDARTTAEAVSDFPWHEDGLRGT